MNDKCERKKKQRNGVRVWCYFLKDDYKMVYKQTEYDDEMVNDDDEIPI